MSLNTRLKKIESALQVEQDIIVIYFTGENQPAPSPEEIEKAKQEARANGKQVAFIGGCEEWAK